MLAVIVLVSGAMVMIVELVGSRVLAPFFGNSIIVWTSLIGVIMLSLSVGNFFGGWLADRGARLNQLSYIIFLAGVLIVLIPIFFPLFFELIQEMRLSIVWSSLLAVVSVFFLPNVFMGMVLPYTTKMYTSELSKMGISVGVLYALSTVGGIVGVFAAGFWLIPSFGTKYLLMSVGSVMILMSVVMYFKDLVKILIGTLLVVMAGVVFGYGFGVDGLIAKAESQYNSLEVYETKNEEGVYRYLKANDAVHTVICITCEDKMDNVYKIYRESYCFNPDIKRVLIIGGGGFSMASDILARAEIEKLDVVEIDPEMTRLAREFFLLQDDPRMTIYHEDGRVFLNQNQDKKYDLVIIDAFMNSYSIPFHLTTIETVQKIDNILTEDGLVVVNTISAMEGEKSTFLQAEYQTYADVFADVSLLSVGGAGLDRLQNVFLFAFKSGIENRKISCGEYFHNDYALETNQDKIILIDDFAPIDNMLLNTYY